MTRKEKLVEERNDLMRALKPWKMILAMGIFGFIGFKINPVWTPMAMSVGFIGSFVYYKLIKGE